MNRTNKDILFALNVIKDVCKTHECYKCPFLDYSEVPDGCKFKTEPPNLWKIKPDTVDNTVWRAFL